MTPAELEKVRKKYPVSAAVARLSLGLNLGTGGDVTKQNMEQTEVPVRSPKRIRQSRDKMNALELEWFGICKSMYPENCVFLAQSIRFRLGNGIWYKPDVLVFGNRVYAYEVKGPHAFRGGFENLKVAASQYSWIKWYLVWKESKNWQEQLVLP